MSVAAVSTDPFTGGPQDASVAHRLLMTALERPAPCTWSSVLDAQDGVIARRQALQGGMSEDAWQWSLERRGWQSVLPGVAVAHGGDLTNRQRAWAAVVYAGHDAALSGDAALVEHGMRLPRPARLDVVVPGHRSVRPQVFAASGRFGSTDQTEQTEQLRLRGHRLKALSALLHPVRRPAAVRVAPAVLHAAAWAVNDRSAEWRVAAAVQQRLVRVPDLRAALLDMPRLSRRALVATVLDDVELGAHARSELDFLALLRRNQLPLPDRLQRPVRTNGLRYLDAWWEAQRVAGEVDGAHHRDVGTWDADLLRANDVQVSQRHDRVVMLRFTMGNLRHDESQVAGQLRVVLL